MKKEITIEIEALGYRAVPLKYNFKESKKESIELLTCTLFGLNMFRNSTLTYSIKDTGFSLITSSFEEVIRACKYLIKIKKNKIKITVSH